MVMAQVFLDEYSNRVFEVVKAKYGLKDKSDAINRFVKMYGDDLVEQEPNDEYVKKVLEISERHHKKHPNRKMTLQELDKLLGA